MQRSTIAGCLLALGLTALFTAGTTSAATDKRDPVRPFGSSGLLTLPKLGSYKTYIESCTAGSGDDLVFNYRTSRRIGKTRKPGWAIYRAKANGKPNRRFGRAGIVRRIPGLDGSPVQVAVDPEGRLIIAFVTKRDSAGKSKVMLARLGANGSLDQAFGAGGIIDTTLSGSRRIYQLERISDGSIVLVQGGAGGYPVSSGTVARFTRDGALDTSFSDDGKWTQPRFFPQSMDFHNGSFYIGGDQIADEASEASDKATVFKLTTSGVTDPTWGTLGSVTVAGGSPDGPGSFLHVEAQADGSLAVAGFDEISGDQEEWTEYWTKSVDAAGTLVPRSRAVVYLTYGLLNQLDPQPEYFAVAHTMDRHGRFVVAGFGDGKERYSVEVRALAPGGKLRKLKRRPPKSFFDANASLAVLGPRALLACGSRGLGKSSFAAAFKMTLP